MFDSLSLNTYLNHTFWNMMITIFNTKPIFFCWLMTKGLLIENHDPEWIKAKNDFINKNIDSRHCMIQGEVGTLRRDDCIPVVHNFSDHYLGTSPSMYKWDQDTIHQIDSNIRRGFLRDT